MNTWTIFNLNPPKSGTSFLQATTEAAGTVPVVGADGANYNITTRRYVAGTAIPTLSDPFSQLRRGAQNILMMPPDYKDGDVWKWSFDVQRELPWEVAMTVGYVGTKGSHVGNSIQNYNDARPSTNTDVQSRRPYQRFYDPALPQFGIQNLGNVRYIDSYGESFYQALQVKVDKRYKNGLSGGIAYTYSKAYGDGENGGQEGASYQDALNRLASRGRFRFDQTHNFVAHYVWELPGRDMTGAWKYFIGGWQSNGILSLRTGFPFAIGQGNDLNTGNAPIRPDRIKDGRIENPSRQLYFDPLSFQRVTCNNPQRPDLCRFGTAGYNILNTPGQRNLDFSLYKNFVFKERYSVQFRSEFFNAFNTPYFGQPNPIGFTTVNSVVPDASRMGEIRSIRTPMRIIQFGLKFFF
jgi:hypothetical protein